MASQPTTVAEAQVQQTDFADRWSKDLIGGAQVPADAGFNLGVASYHATEFGQAQVHDDQEALYVISGEGEILLNDQTFPLSPGAAVYVPPGTRHATRRTGEQPVKVVYCHGAT